MICRAFIVYNFLKNLTQIAHVLTSAIYAYERSHESTRAHTRHPIIYALECAHACTHVSMHERRSGTDANRVVRRGMQIERKRERERERRMYYTISRLCKRFCQLYVATRVHSRIARALQSASSSRPHILPSCHRSYQQSQPPRRDCVFRGACRLSPFKTVTPNAERVSPRVDGKRILHRGLSGGSNGEKGEEEPARRSHVCGRLPCAAAMALR